MKTILLAISLSLGLAGSAAVKAEDAATGMPPQLEVQTPYRFPVEFAELKWAHDAALKANPALAAELKQLRILKLDHEKKRQAAQLAGRPLTAAEGKPFWDLQRDFKQKLQAAMIQADPEIEPLIRRFFSQGPGAIRAQPGNP
jgi:hypothetical protein